VDVPDSDIVRRLSGRRVCLKCGATYHTRFNPPRVEGICDSCGEALVHRDDDKPETIQKRLDVYHSQTQPLIEYYHEAGCMYKVDGTRSLEDVFASICAILE
jgi:adenylate kinase